MPVELSTSDKLHNEENPVFSLEDIFHIDHEGVRSVHQNLFFKQAVVNQSFLDQEIFSNGFHCINLVISAHQKNFSKTAFTYKCFYLEFLHVLRLVILILGNDKVSHMAFQTFGFLCAVRPLWYFQAGHGRIGGKSILLFRSLLRNLRSHWHTNLLGLVNIFSPKAVHFLRNDLKTFLYIFFRGVIRF